MEKILKRSFNLTPKPEYDFYSKKIDGRFKIKITKGENVSKNYVKFKEKKK